MRAEKQMSAVDTRGAVLSAAGETALGYVSEVFCSIQGEGLRVGERQVFLRTAGCSATCYWCDTVSSKKERTHCLIHGKTREALTNPLTVAQTVSAVCDLIDAFAPVGTVSLTGGEPLEQSDFVRAVASVLRKHGARIYLETSGLEPGGLEQLRPYVDIVAMDIKLPYATGQEHWDTHREFLTSLLGKEFFVKVVVDDITPFSEIKTAVELITSVDAGVPLVLQPESTTYLKNGKGADARKRLAKLLEDGQRFALEHLRDVRVIPQCHKLLKVR